MRSVRPYEECPRFAECSVNVCPLDPDINKRSHLPGEPRCTLAKANRTRIGEQHLAVLPYGGLYRAEWDRHSRGLAQWLAKTPEQQAAQRAIGTAALGKARNTVQATAKAGFALAHTDSRARVGIDEVRALASRGRER